MNEIKELLKQKHVAKATVTADNVPCHTAPDVRELFDKGDNWFFKALPPYSPILNPCKVAIAQLNCSSRPLNPKLGHSNTHNALMAPPTRKHHQPHQSTARKRCKRDTTNTLTRQHITKQNSHAETQPDARVRDEAIRTRTQRPSEHVSSKWREQSPSHPPIE